MSAIGIACRGGNIHFSHNRPDGVGAVTDAIFVTDLPGVTDYSFAVSCMEKVARAVGRGDIPDVFWLLEHSSVYTAGRSSGKDEVLDRSVRPVPAYRGGKVTYHGPGQKVLYIMMNLRRKYLGVIDIRQYVQNIEDGVISFLLGLGIVGERRPGATGVWVRCGCAPDTATGDGLVSNEYWAKIASIGVGVSGGVTMHGCGINVSTDLSMFEKIIPCGIVNEPVCSVSSLLDAQDWPIGDGGTELNIALFRSFASVFNVLPVAPFEPCSFTAGFASGFPCYRIGDVLGHITD